MQASEIIAFLFIYMWCHSLGCSIFSFCSHHEDFSKISCTSFSCSRHKIYPQCNFLVHICYDIGIVFHNGGYNCAYTFNIAPILPHIAHRWGQYYAFFTFSSSQFGFSLCLMLLLFWPQVYYFMISQSAHTFHTNTHTHHILDCCIITTI